MANEKNVIIKITADASGVRNAETDLQSLQDRERDIMNEMRKSQTEYQKQLALIQQNVKGRDEQIKAIDKLQKAQEKQQRSLDAELKKSKQSMTEFNASVKNVNDTVAKGSMTNQRMTTQLRAMREELARMEEAGQAGSQAFVDLSIKAGKLQDQIGDTQQRIRILSSDTKNLDATLSVGQGLAGTFNVATNAMALLGGESEMLQEAFYKTQSALAILNGVQEVANVLNKDSVARVVIGTAVQKIFNREQGSTLLMRTANNIQTRIATATENASTVSKYAGAVASRVLGSAMKSIPFIAIASAIIAVVAGIAKFVSSSKEAKRTQDDFNATLNQTKRNLQMLKSDTEFNVKLAVAQGKAQDEILKIKIQSAKRELDEADVKYNLLQTKFNNADKASRKELSAGLNEAKGIRDEAWSNYKASLDDQLIYDVEQQAEANKNKLEKQKEYNEKRKEEIATATKELATLTVEAIKDDEQREIEGVRLKYKRKIEEITGNSKVESDLRKALTSAMNKEITDIEKKYDSMSVLSFKDYELEKLRIRMQSNENDLTLQELYLSKKASRDVTAVEQSTQSEQEKADAITLINLQLNADLEKIEEKRKLTEIQQSLSATNQVLKAEELANQKILYNSNNSVSARLQASNRLIDIEAKRIQNEADANETAYAQALITYKEYIDKKNELSNQSTSNEIEKVKKAEEKKQLVIQKSYEVAQALGDWYFESQMRNIEDEKNALDTKYTTDAESAKKNKDLILITEAEMARKKSELRLKEAKAQREQAIFNIITATAQAVISALASVPPNVPLSIFAGVLGGVQLAKVISTPLPKYAKGKKSNQSGGSLSMVGELGAELMYVPDNASILPAQTVRRGITRKDLSSFGIPFIDDTKVPQIEARYIRTKPANDLDYDKLGRNIAKYIKYPSQKQVTVNVDKNGIVISNDGGSERFLNKKFNQSWS